MYADSYLIAVVFYIFFCLYFAFYWAVWGFVCSIIKKYFSKPWLFIVLSACAWVVLEYIRTYALTGWPWLCISYSQYLFTYIIQIAEFTGIYGVSFAIILVNGFLYFGIFEKKKSYLLAAAAVFAVLFIGGIYRHNTFIDFGGKEYTAVAVQSNIEQYKKLTNYHKKEINAKLEEFAAEMAEIKADLNVWSESEIINVIPEDEESYLFADMLAKKAGKFNIIGAPHIDEDGNLFNCVFYFDGSGGYIAMHAKNHLVPFGEYIPISESFAQLLGITEKADDLIKGTDTNVFTNGELYVGPLICSENFFPDIVSRFVMSGAKVLTNHTNDAWYFDTSAPYKHFCANVFRAVESRKAIITSANTGVSAIIDPTGKINHETRVCERTLFAGTFRQNDYKTFYVLHGDIFAVACVIVVMFFVVVIFVKRYKLKNGNKTNL